MKKASAGRSGTGRGTTRLTRSSSARNKKKALLKGTRINQERRRAVFRLKKASAVKHKIILSRGNPAAKNLRVIKRGDSAPAPSSTKNSVISVTKSAALKQYESGIKLMYSQDFEGAKGVFAKIISAYPEDKEIQERVKTHLRLCVQKMARRPSAPKTLEEHYDVGVALMNQGQYGEAQDHFQKALKLNPKSDFVIYAMSALSCRMGDLENAIEYLKSAIQLRPDNRYLAQHDSDFELIVQDVRFQAIVFPERSEFTPS